MYLQKLDYLSHMKHVENKSMNIPAVIQPQTRSIITFVFQLKKFEKKCNNNQPALYN